MHVAFDIGNVLCHFDPTIYNKELHRMIHHDVRFIYWENVVPHLENMEKLDYLGMINRSKHLETTFRINNADYLNDIWNSTVTINNQMMNFLVKLKDAGVKIALLSNMGPDHAKYLREKYPELFDKTIQHLSFEAGAFKPSKLFYQSFLMSNEDFAGCVYLDDVKENIISGTKMKFDAIHFDLRDFEKPSELKKRLETIYDKITTGI